MKKYSVTEAELPKRMRKFLCDIDEGKVFSAKTLRTNRAGVSSALRGLIETARRRQLPEKLGKDTAEAFLARLTEEGWQNNSLIGLKTLLRHYAYETDEGVDWALASGSTDRRPLPLVFKAAHWNPFRSLIAEINEVTPAPVIRMADRWFRYRAQHARVDEAMVLRFDVDASSLSRLSEFLTAIDPENPDNIILQQAQRKRGHAEAGYRKKALKRPYHGIPEPFYGQISALFDEKPGLSVPRLKSICSALRRLCTACDAVQLPYDLTEDTARAFVDGLFEDDLAMRSIAAYCDFLACFAKKTGYPREISAALMEVHNATKLESKTDLRRKEKKLAQYPIDLVDIALTAHTLLEQACDQDDIRNRRRDYVLAGAVALLSKLQLRTLDLRQGVLGREFRRDSEGWIVDLKTSKTGTSIKGRLAPELTRYLDAVLLMDVSEAHLWSVYARRVGTALFGNPAQGWTPYGKNWLWRNMTERLHHGPHIVRTLIYDAVAADADLDAAVAQSLCGHGNFTSRKFYEIGADRHRRKAGMQILSKIAKGLDQECRVAPHFQ